MMVPFLMDALLATSALLQPTEYAGDPIIVTAQRLRDSKDNLKACLARNCPPDEDIDASLELAEVQVDAGEYRDARTTLLKSIKRNKNQAARYPVPVADLYRANGRVAANLGLDRSYYLSTLNILRSLEAGIPEKDYRYFSARMEIAGMVGRLKGHERARLAYEKIADDARRAGRRDVAAMALLKLAASHLPPGDLQERRIRRIAESTDPQERIPMLQAKLLLAQYAYRDENFTRFNQIVGEFANLRLTKPLLIYAPPYRFAAQEADQFAGAAGTFEPTQPNPNDPAPAGGGGGGGRQESVTGPRGNIFPVTGFSTTRRIPDNYERRWVDVTFTVQPDGRVGHVDVGRTDGEVSWAESLVEAIRGRIYTPIVANSPAAVRRERYTLTAGYEDLATSTRTAMRSPRARVEYIDMTPDIDNGLSKERLQ